MHVNDEERIKHIREAALEACELIRDETRQDLDTDRKLSLALVRLLEIVGEAANGISSGYRQGHPELPWNGMVSMRNRLIHGYFDINLDIVWKTIQEDLPYLLEKLQS
jgi:uncharacterized protein with HEPN domain